ncbi:MAG: hypothetical protein JWR25_475 [Noviherbaspirillum sp.]|nr:hypothetical protein [Noviherbaspirillum sp.]
MDVADLDDARLHWVPEWVIASQWDAKILEQVPKQLIAWRNVGSPNESERAECYRAVRSILRERLPPTLYGNASSGWNRLHACNVVT